MHDMTKPAQYLYVDALYYVNIDIELIERSVVSYPVLAKYFNWAKDFTKNFSHKRFLDWIILP